MPAKRAFRFFEKYFFSSSWIPAEITPASLQNAQDRRNHPRSKGKTSGDASPTRKFFASEYPRCSSLGGQAHRYATKTAHKAESSSFASRGFREGRRGNDDRQNVRPAREFEAGIQGII
jgi:hypothetical protein